MKALLLVCAGLLLLGIASLPIGYYTLLRIVVCITAGIVIYSEFQSALTVWIIVFGIMAILFNPIIPVYLDNKGAWIPIDLICGIICLIKAFSKNNTKNYD